MADHITLPAPTAGYAPHRAGSFAAVCVDLINLGDRLETFPGSEPKITPKVALVFATGERNEFGDLHIVSRELTLSSGQNASLRKLLESWRGKPYTDVELQGQLPLHKLCGQPAFISVEHHQSAKGRTYAKLGAVMPVPKGYTLDTAAIVGAYTRAPYWQERKDDYAGEVARYRAATRPAAPSGDDAIARVDAAIAAEDEALPF